MRSGSAAAASDAGRGARSRMRPSNNVQRDVICDARRTAHKPCNARPQVEEHKFSNASELGMVTRLAEQYSELRCGKMAEAVLDNVSAGGWSHPCYVSAGT